MARLRTGRLESGSKRGLVGGGRDAKDGRLLLFRETDQLRNAPCFVKWVLESCGTSDCAPKCEKKGELETKIRRDSISRGSTGESSGRLFVDFHKQCTLLRVRYRVCALVRVLVIFPWTQYGNSGVNGFNWARCWQKL